MPKNVQQAKTRARLRRAESTCPASSIENPQGEARADSSRSPRPSSSPSGPIIYAGGGIISGEASEELRALAKKTGIPVTMTVMGLGAFPARRSALLDMLGMHGSVYANYAVEQADLLIALGVRFDDRVTGKVEEFCKHGKIVHVDIDASELNKNKPAHIPVCSDVKYALAELNKIVEAPGRHLRLGRAMPASGSKTEPFHYNESFPGILQQHAIRELWKLTHDRDPIITVGVGQHQMWAAQFYKFDQAAHVPLQQRPGHDGLRPARRRWACRASSPIAS